MKNEIITCKSNTEFLLKSLNRNLSKEHKINVRFPYPKKNINLTKNNAVKICEQITQYHTTVHGFSCVRAFINPTKKRKMKTFGGFLENRTGLSIMAADLHVKNSEHVSRLLPRIALIRDFPPNFYLHTGERNFTFFWCLEEFQEIIAGVNECLIDDFLKKFENHYKHEVVNEYNFKPVTYDAEFKVPMPGFISAFDSSDLFSDFCLKLYYYDYTVSNFSLIERVYSEPQQFQIRPYRLDTFMDIVGCTPLN